MVEEFVDTYDRIKRTNGRRVQILRGKHPSRMTLDVCGWEFTIFAEVDAQTRTTGRVKEVKRLVC